jgi:hypothetical protein
VEPDVTVVKVDDDYVVLFNDDGLPGSRSPPCIKLLLSKDGAIDGEGKYLEREGCGRPSG